MLRHALAIEHLARSDDDHEQHPEPDALEQREDDVLGHESGIGRGGRIIGQRERPRIERHSGHEDDAGDGDGDQQFGPDVAAQQTDDEHRHGSNHRQQEEDDVDISSQQILRAQLAVAALPFIRHADALVVVGDAIAINAHFMAIRRASGMDRLRLPGEDPLRPSGQPAFALRNELEIAEFDSVPIEKQLGRSSRRGAIDLRQGSILRDFLSEADQLAGRSNLDVVLLFLQRPEPTIPPPPEAHLPSHDRVRAGQSDRTLEENLRRAVAVENRGVLHAARIESLPRQNRLGQRHRRLTVVSELDRGLGEGHIEQAEDDEEGDGGDRRAYGNQRPVAPRQPLSQDDMPTPTAAAPSPSAGCLPPPRPWTG